jgi:hypothetical protein
VSFGEVVGDVQPDETESHEAAKPAPPLEAPSHLDPATLRREMARLRRRDARLRAT